jgi:DNA-binding Lrp family transcriptional regulator/DNA-binding transcriptional ArsR family regulator
MSRDTPHSRLRVAARLANGFALDLVKLGGFGRDVIDALLLCAISQANVAQITRNPELQTRYATLDQPPPDDLRRPVSISATANSLRIPFETARRRIAALAELGIVIIHARGVTIPTAPMNSPFYRMASAAHYELVRQLYFRLRGIGLLEDLARPETSIYDPANPPVRLVTRLSSDYVLRLAEPINQHIGDLVTGIVLMAVIHANTEHLPDDEGEEAIANPIAAALALDAQRRPVRASVIAERLGMPHETIRRHLGRLHDTDRCERNGDGYVVTTRILAREPFFRHMMDNQSHLHRLYAQLSDYGVLFEWEREVQALRGAA